MFFDAGLKKALTEKIGLFGPLNLLSVFESAFQENPYRFYQFTDPKTFCQWVMTNQPRLVFMDGKFLKQSHQTHIERFKSILMEYRVPTLVSAETLEEIRFFKNHRWPMVQFYHAPLQSHYLKEHIHQLIRERLFLEKPLVAVLSDQFFFITQLEMLLKNNGLRVRALPLSSLKGDLETMIASLTPSVVLCDISMAKKLGNKLKSQLETLKLSNSTPLVWVTESPDLQEIISFQEKHNLNQEVISIHQHGQLMAKMEFLLKEKFSFSRSTERRPQTGLLLNNFFTEAAEREWKEANHLGRPFSIMKIKIGNLQKIDSHYGGIFVRELEAHLGIFVQNRVRSSDLVGEGKDGVILILLSRINDSLALLIGERLKHQFAEVCRFEEDATVFIPELVYSFDSYPTQMHSMEDLAVFTSSNLEEVSEEKSQVPEIKTG